MTGQHGNRCPPCLVVGVGFWLGEEPKLVLGKPGTTDVTANAEGSCFLDWSILETSEVGSAMKINKRHARWLVPGIHGSRVNQQSSGMYLQGIDDITGTDSFPFRRGHLALWRAHRQ
ncbi:unnamed protein product [Protopolystoma xenopodis]|uniref:Uncharacterized protein n=1 Tax=Protopolystoma xenopodis TaxID=117903 RepID=A0A3S5C0H6_9PLAT|nr:unnamed protein product [Protopolystoma xenopodis]